MNGYTVEEAARVLGIPTERVWDLVARGIFSGGRGEDGTWRVHLGGAADRRTDAAPAAGASTDSHHIPDAYASGAAGAEVSPFRELLTEFRHLTERYGQALLALGEARGEVASLSNRVDALEARVELRLPYSAAGPAVGKVSRRAASSAADDGEPEPFVAVQAAPPPVEVPAAAADDEVQGAVDGEPSALQTEGQAVEAESAEPADATTGQPEPEAVSEAEAQAEAPAEASVDTDAEIEEAQEQTESSLDAEAPAGAETEAFGEEPAEASTAEEPVEAASTGEEPGEAATVEEPVEAASAVERPSEAEPAVEEPVEAASAVEERGRAEEAAAADLGNAELGEPELPNAELPSAELPAQDEDFETIDDLLVFAGDDAQDTRDGESVAEGEIAAGPEVREEPEPAPDVSEEPEPAPDVAAAPESGDAIAAAADTGDELAAAAEGVEDVSTQERPIEETPGPEISAEARVAAFDIETGERSQPRRHRLGSEIAAALARADDPSPPELPNGAEHVAAASGAEPVAETEQSESRDVDEPPFPSTATAFSLAGRQADEAEYIAEMEIGSAGWHADSGVVAARGQAAAAVVTDALATDPYPDQNELINALGWEQDEIDAIRSLLSGEASGAVARPAWPAADPDVRPSPPEAPASEPEAAAEAVTAAPAAEAATAVEEPAEAVEEPPTAAIDEQTEAREEPAQAVEEQPPAAVDAVAQPPRGATVEETDAAAQERTHEPEPAQPDERAQAPQAEGTPRVAQRGFELPGSADLDAALEALRRRSSEEAAAEDARRGIVRESPPPEQEAAAPAPADATAQGDEAVEGQAHPRPTPGLDDAAWSRRSPAANAYRRLRRFLGG